LFQIRPLLFVQKYDKKGPTILEIDLQAEQDVSKINKEVGSGDLRDITEKEFLVTSSGNLGMSPEKYKISTTSITLQHLRSIPSLSTLWAI
jgi:hypothetical protein